MSVQLLFVQTTPPHGSIVGQEGLDACLAGSAYSSCAMLFLGDGIYQITRGQNTEKLGLKDYSVSYGALRDYGVEEIYCLQSDLEQRGLDPEKLIIDVKVLAEADARSLLQTAGQVLTF